MGVFDVVVCLLLIVTMPTTPKTTNYTTHIYPAHITHPLTLQHLREAVHATRAVFVSMEALTQHLSRARCGVADGDGGGQANNADDCPDVSSCKGAEFQEVRLLARCRRPPPPHHANCHLPSLPNNTP